LTICGMALAAHCFSQDSTIHFARLVDTSNTKSNIKEDSVLRIRNLNPYITLHVDSTLFYELEINKDHGHYFWYLKN
jgi:hypothetical protein